MTGCLSGVVGKRFVGVLYGHVSAEPDTELFEEEECEDGVRSEPGERRNEALVEGGHAIRSNIPHTPADPCNKNKRHPFINTDTKECQASEERVWKG